MVHHLLNRTFEIWRATTVDDDGGGQVTTWEQVGTVKARTSRPTATEREISQQERGWVDYEVYVAPDADVIRRDELREDGLTLKVLATMYPSKAIYKKCECEEQQPIS